MKLALPEPLIYALTRPGHQCYPGVQISCRPQGVMRKEPEVGVGIPRGGKNKLGPLGEENLARVSLQNRLGGWLGLGSATCWPRDLGQITKKQQNKTNPASLSFSVKLEETVITIANLF